MIGENITKIRKSRGYTLSELAELSNVSKSYLSNIERDINKNPSVQVIQKVANVLRVDLVTLIMGKESSENHTIFEKEWLDFLNELKELGINKYQIREYKTLIEFIKWQNENSQKEK